MYNLLDPLRPEKRKRVKDCNKVIGHKAKSECFCKTSVTE